MWSIVAWHCLCLLLLVEPQGLLMVYLAFFLVLHFFAFDVGLCSLRPGLLAQSLRRHLVVLAEQGLCGAGRLLVQGLLAAGASMSSSR